MPVGAVWESCSVAEGPSCGCREAVRGDDLIIMQAGQASMASSSVSSGGVLQLMAVIDKLENERVAGGGRCWVAHALICTGESRSLLGNAVWHMPCSISSWLEGLACQTHCSCLA